MSDDLVKRLREDQPVTQDMGSTMQCALQDQAAYRIEELEAKLAKAMQVVEMIASADVDAALGQAVDISCEIIGELMEDEDDE